MKEIQKIIRIGALIEKLREKQLKLAKEAATAQGKKLYKLCSESEIVLADYVIASSEEEAERLGVTNAIFFDIDEYRDACVEYVVEV